MKLTMTAITAALALLPAAALAQTPAPGQAMNHMMHDAAPLLSFSVSEEVRRAPDRATIGAGVTTAAPTATEALRANSVAMERLVRAARARGIKSADIQTTGVNLSPQYDYSPQQRGEPPRFTGYQVSNMVRATTDRIGALGELLDALVAAGATNLDGPNFSVADMDGLLVPARAAAMRKANDKAADYARVAGYRSARLVSISEGGGYSGPMPMSGMAVAEASAAKAVIEPGQVGNTLTLSVQYRLER